jgi:hypothetical protein
MMLQGCRKADRAEVVERDRFATPNYLKPHGERNLFSPLSNPCAITPKLCMPSRPIHPSKNYPALKSRTAAKSPSARGTAGAPLPAISCLGAFGRRPQERVDSVVIPASKKQHRSGHAALYCQGRDRSLGNGVFVDNAVLQDDQKLVRWVSNEVYIFQGIAVDDYKISEGTLFNDAQFAGIKGCASLTRRAVLRLPKSPWRVLRPA